MNKHEATDSRGVTHKRGSKNRTYTHCVVAFHRNPTFTVEGREYTVNPTVSWAGSPALAEARAQTFRNQKRYTDPTISIYSDVEIIEARKV